MLKLISSVFRFLLSPENPAKDYGNDYRPIVPWLILGALSLLVIIIVAVVIAKIRKARKNH